MLVKNLSAHLLNDRMERMLTIANTIGFGESYLLEVQEETGCWLCLSNTGVLFIEDTTRTYTITIIVPDIQRIAALYKRAGYDGMPQRLITMVKKNRKKVGRHL